MSRNFFIIGTDTNSGKTWVTQHLISMLQQQNHAIALKPIVCGINDNGKYDDIETLLKAQKQYDPSMINRYRFKKAAAPSIAAAAEQQNISIAELSTWCEQQRASIQLIEGIGGLMVPINATATGLDWLERMPKAAIILVVGLRLGCINHTLLTLKALNSMGRSPDWIILNDLENNKNIAETQHSIQAHLSADTKIISCPAHDSSALTAMIQNLRKH